MNGGVLEDLLAHVPGARGVWRGVFPRDKIPQRVTYPSAYVFNTHPHNKEGEHWVAVYIDGDGVGEYFDSFGLPPLLESFGNFMFETTVEWIFNRFTIQGVTANTCGHFCVYYLARKFAGDSMRGILAEFSEDERRNDDIVYDFVDRIAVT